MHFRAAYNVGFALCVALMQLNNPLRVSPPNKRTLAEQPTDHDSGKTSLCYGAAKDQDPT